MKSQELLKELKSFPKEYQPDGDRQRKTLQHIMDFYDEYEKKNKKAFSFQKWQAAAAGLAAVILACFLFLPNLLNQENKGHEAVPPKENKSMINTPTVEKKNRVVSPNEQFHSKELAEVKAISISNSKGIEVKKVTNPALIKFMVEKFKESTLVEKQNKDKENSISGETYIINFELKDGLIEVQYWPAEKGANVIDIQQRSWWRVEDLNVVLGKLSLSVNLNPEQVTKILYTLYPKMNWDNEYSLVFQDNASPNVYVAKGITSSGELLQIRIDPITGKVIKEEKPESTAEAVKAAQTFFHLVNTGNDQMAWDLVHPTSKEPSPGVTEEQSQNSFYQYFNSHHLSLNKIDSAEWTPNGYKFDDCMCSFDKEVLIKATLSDGTKIEFHTIKDDDDQWKLYWSPIENKLK